MRILSWNIQATQGCDGHFNLDRITQHIKHYGELDAICLQEVARHIADLNGDDQLSGIAQQFPEHTALWAPGFSVPDQDVKLDKPSEFGNLTLVKKGILRNSRTHLLPSPAIQNLQIPRTMVETVLAYNDSLLTVFNAHLAFHSSAERIEQIKALSNLRDQIMSKSRARNTLEGIGPYRYIDASEAVVLCGDLNVSVDSDEFQTHILDKQWTDCWQTQKLPDHAARSARQPTCGVFDHVHWPDGAHVRDYFLTTGNLHDSVTSVSVDIETDASDHQPIMLELSV